MAKALSLAWPEVKARAEAKVHQKEEAELETAAGNARVTTSPTPLAPPAANLLSLNRLRVPHDLLD